MSLRHRIFWWLFGALTISAVILFVTFYTLTSRLLYAQTDREIQSHAAAIVNLASQQVSMFSQQILENSPGMMLVVGDPQGEVIASTLTEAESKREMGRLIEKSAGLLTPSFLNKQVGTNSMRIGIFPVAREEATEMLVLVGHPTDVIDHALARLVYQLVLAISLIILLSVILSMWITRAVMAPITSLTEKLESVSDANLTVEIEETKTKDELARLTHAFANMMGRIRASFTRERQMIGELAHELKTPLAIAKSKLELNKNNEEALTAVDRVGKTLEEMLDLAWASAEQPLSDRDQVRLDLLTLEAVEAAQALAARKKLKFTIEIEPEVTVQGKKEKLFRVLINVLDNAVKYSDRGGKIGVLLQTVDGQAKLEVSNTGKGISTDDLPHIFDRYYRGRGAGKKKGSGLGLAIVKRIVEAHRGKVAVFTSPNKLTTVRVTLDSRSS